MVLPFDESILEVMIGPNKICEYLHHNSYFLLELSKIENSEFHVRLSECFDQPINPFPKEGLFYEGNMEFFFSTILINISTKIDIMENVYIRENYSPQEIPFIQLCSINFMMCFHGITNKFPESTHLLWNMK